MKSSSKSRVWAYAVWLLAVAVGGFVLAWRLAGWDDPTAVALSVLAVLVPTVVFAAFVYRRLQRAQQASRERTRRRGRSQADE